MAAANVLRSKNESVRNKPERYTCEELIRLLVSQTVSRNDSDSPNGEGEHRECHEEVILEIDLDGARYLLVRLAQETQPQVRLSAREREIVRMVANGLVNKMIADVLNISPWTVCTHLRRIFAKLGVGSRAAMVAKVLGESGSWKPGLGGGKTFVKATNPPQSLHPLPRTSRVEKAAPTGGQFPSRKAS